MAELLRTLEVTITRRLDGVLHGNHQGLTPGHGSEPGEARLYQPGDDVRRIDWNVTARTQQTHIRELIADRDLEAWLVVDASAAMRFGTEHNQKAQVALAAAAAVGFLTARNQNRLGAILVAGPELHTVPPRGGRTQVQAILSKIAAPPPSEGHGRADLAGAIDRVGALSKRRGFVAVIADFVGSAWVDPLARLGLRHDLLAITVSDPRARHPADRARRDGRSLDRSGPRGPSHRVGPATFRRARRRNRPTIDGAVCDVPGCELIELSTGDDWLGAIVSHVHRRRRQAVRGDTLRR